MISIRFVIVHGHNSKKVILSALIVVASSAAVLHGTSYYDATLQQAPTGWWFNPDTSLALQAKSRSLGWQHWGNGAVTAVSGQYPWGLITPSQYSPVEDTPEVRQAKVSHALAHNKPAPWVSPAALWSRNSQFWY